MVAYLANRIVTGALEYEHVVSLRPDLKDLIDIELNEMNRGDLIVHTSQD